MNYVTMGGVTIGICILVATLVRWWPGLKPLKKYPLRHLKALSPFLASCAYGCLTILGVGGIIGWLAKAARWITNWLGDAALVWGVGGNAQDHASAAAYIPLTYQGGGIVLILTAVIIVAMKKSNYGNDMKMGVWCGICLGTSAGVAGFAAVPLATAANWIGGLAYGNV